MFLYEIQDAFVEALRARVKNGEITERALAKLVGISQPHLHNVLKGVRRLSPGVMDRCLYQLRLSVFDLVDRTELAAFLDSERPEATEYAYLPVLAGRIGPSHVWPSEVDRHARFPVPSRIIRLMWHPVVARTEFDVRMLPTFGADDHLLLDQSRAARLEIDPSALYVIKRGRVGLVRRLRSVAGQVHLVTEDTVDRPGMWEKLPVEGVHVLHFIRARATLIAPEYEWA
jgi:hypothetical protein